METSTFDGLTSNNTAGLMTVQEKVIDIITNHPQTIRHELYLALSMQTGESISTLYIIESLVRSQRLLQEA